MERQTESLRRDLGTSLDRARAEALGRFADVVDFDDSSLPARRKRVPLGIPLGPLATVVDLARAPYRDEILPHARF